MAFLPNRLSYYQPIIITVPDDFECKIDTQPCKSICEFTDIKEGGNTQSLQSRMEQQLKNLETLITSPPG